MKGLKAVGGYTITETMLFLLITAALLASGILVFAGRNERTQYTQSIRETDQQIRTIINEVSSGFFPSTELNCTDPGGDIALSINPKGTSEQGTRSECIFLGKVIHFTEDSLDVYTLAGARKIGSRNVETITEAKPIVVEALNQSYGISNSVDIYKTLGRVCEVDPAAAIAVIQPLGSSNPSGDPVSGSQSAEYKVICGSEITSTEVDMIKLLNYAPGVALNNIYKGPASDGFKFCMGEQKYRHGSITVGGGAQQFGTETIIDDDTGDCS